MSDRDRDEIREIGKRALEDWHDTMFRVFVKMGLLHEWDLAPWIREDEIVWSKPPLRPLPPLRPMPSFDPIVPERRRMSPPLLSHGARDLILE